MEWNELIVLVLVIIGVFIILSVILSMWKKVPQDKAAVVTGLRKKIITGGGGLVIPVLERIDYISLGNIQIDVVTDESMSSQGVPIAVVGTAVIKVKNEQNAIFNAIEQFTGKNETQIEASIKNTATNVLEG
ncbi:MAG: flotillin family protein, partial [Lachnospiraceae bacterium]|nr:flotillin family protein [Lachnospiraceae bacterium]